MAATRNEATRRSTAAAPAASPHRWLLFVHLLPSSPSNIRVRTWRRMQQIGAVVVKQSVYVLPDSPNAREDFEWLKTEIEAAGGQASVFAADTVDAWSNDALVEEFRRSGEDAYNAVAREAEQRLRRMGSSRRGSRRVSSRRVIEQLRERLTAIERVDFFGSAGRDRAIALLRQIEERANLTRHATATGQPAESAESYKARTWVTRPRPGVDRMASAWLIRRFIDPEARFGFVADRDAAASDSIPFDMFGVHFTHRGDLCTFEALREAFQLDDAALNGIAAIVHDLDLKDGRFGAPEAPTVGLIIEGLRLSHADDHELLAEGMTLFEALYQALAHAHRATGPRRVARRQPGRRRARSR